MVLQGRPCKAFVWKLVKQTFEERSEARTDIVGEFHRVFHNEMNEGVDIVGIEGRDTNEKFVQDNA